MAKLAATATDSRYRAGSFPSKARQAKLMAQTSGRILSVDVYRGMVMLLLLPNVSGGFSFYIMHKQFPDDPLWTALATAFTHVQWTGASIWDLIAPSFIFLVGVAMPLSASARQQRGESQRDMFRHICLRSAALFLLGLLLTMPQLTRLDELWPLILLAVALPIPRRLATAFGLTTVTAQRRLETIWWLTILIASTVWSYTHINELGNYDLVHVFNTLALASVPAFLFLGKPRHTQFGAAFAILVFYWLMFVFYPLPASGFDAATVGLKSGDEVFSGFFAHWNKNTNIAAAFDVWFLNLLPRAEPFLFQGNGVQTLNFIPTISTMIFGIMAGELVISGLPKAQIRNTLLSFGMTGIVAGLIAGEWFCPIVKSIWTPSWTLFSAGFAAIILGALYHVCDFHESRSWVFPFVVIGTNSILLYTLASYYRWRFLVTPAKLLGINIPVGPYSPVLESVAFCAILWFIAFALYQFKIFVRI
jgi:heparan-alpha-glucosaminide N-acetyltransferase